MLSEIYIKGYVQVSKANGGSTVVEQSTHNHKLASLNLALSGTRERKREREREKRTKDTKKLDKILKAVKMVPKVLNFMVKVSKFR